MLAVEITDTSVEPLGTEANWTLGADMDCSSKPLLAMASSSSVAGRVVAQAAQEAKAPAQQRIRSVLVGKQLGLKVVIGNILLRVSTGQPVFRCAGRFMFSIFVIIESQGQYLFSCHLCK
jgi:hypothetical protein